MRVSGTTLAAVAVWAFSSNLSFAQTTSRIRFVEKSDAAGITIRTTNGDPARKYIIETLGSGAAMLDYDLDGDVDIYTANGSMLEPIPEGQEPVAALYRNDGSGRFADIAESAGLAEHFWGFGVAAGDYDNDGDPDLYVTARGPNRLYRNNGVGTFTEVGRAAGVDSERHGSSAAFLDYDRDGALDLYVANYVSFDPNVVPAKGDPNNPCLFRGLTVMCGPHGLPGEVDHLYHNNGDGTFTDLSVEAGLFTDGGYYGLGVVTADMDGDGLVDILVANDSTPNHFYRNLGDGRFVDDALIAGFAYSNDGREQAGMGIDASDIDRDGDLDVYVTNFSHDYSTLRINNGAGLLEDVTVRMGLVEPTVSSLGWGTLIFDIENDGDMDLFAANGHVYPEIDNADIGSTYLQRNQVFENRGPLMLRELVPEAGDALLVEGRHRSVAGGDIDADGDIDLLVTVMNGQPRLLVNESTTGAWLLVRLAGRVSNRDGLGAKVKVRAGDEVWMSERMGGRSYLSASDPRLHFGLGAVGQVDSVEIQWPSGIVQTVRRPAINAILTVEEPADGANGSKGAKVAPGKTDPP